MVAAATNSVVTGFLDAARHCNSVAALNKSLQQAMDLLGFPRWAYALNGKIEHNFPHEWVERYARQHYAAVDPIITKGGTLSSPFQWSRIAPLSELSAGERAYYGEAMDYGLVDGLGVPVLGGAGRAMFSMASDEAPNKLHRRMIHDRYPLIALAYAYHALHQQVTATISPKDNPLTDREAECLLWTARGKTSWEIGQIVNISERTVVFHIENSKKKLRVKSRSQAAVAAIVSGYIRP